MSGQVSGADVKYDEANAGDKVTRDPSDGSPFFKKRTNDNSVYKLEQYGSISGTKMQKCLAQLELPKVGVDEDIFGSYEIKTGARIYKNYTETSFIQMPETTVVQNIEAPVYSDETIIQAVAATSVTHESIFIDQSYAFDMSTVIEGTSG